MSLSQSTSGNWVKKMGDKVEDKDTKIKIKTPTKIQNHSHTEPQYPRVEFISQVLSQILTKFHLLEQASTTKGKVHRKKK